MTGPKDRYQPFGDPEILVRAGGACWQWLERDSASLSTHWVSHGERSPRDGTQFFNVLGKYLSGLSVVLGLEGPWGAPTRSHPRVPRKHSLVPLGSTPSCAAHHAHVP